MTWERALTALFDDLEQQAEGLALSSRDAEVAEQGRAEYATVDLESRLHGGVGQQVHVLLGGGHQVDGVLARAGVGWCLVEGAAQGSDATGASWVVRLPQVVRVSGLGSHALSPEARPLTARLGVGSVLRRLAESRSPAMLLLSDGSRMRGRVARAGADFVEVVAENGEPVVVALSAVAALRGE